MVQGSAARFPSRRWAAASAVVAAAGAGSLIGLGRAFALAREERWLELGFRRTAYLELTAGSLEGLAWGASAGLLAVLAAVFLVWRWPAGVRPASLVSLLRDRAALPWLFFLIVLLGFFGLGGMLLVQGWLGKADTLGVLATAAVGCLLVALAAARVRAARDPAASEVRAFASGALAAALVFVAGGLGIAARSGREPLSPENLALGVLLAAAVTWAFLGVRGLVRRSSPGGDARASGAARAALWILLLFALAPLGLAALRPFLGRPTLFAERPWSVLLIGIDTLRADATTITGPRADGRDTTPHLRRLAERGIVFADAISQAPWTMPAFASVLTGRYPHEHGAYSLAGRLRASEVTLAEVLREAGYRTGAVISHEYVDAKHGFGQGFELFDTDEVKGHQAITSPGVTQRALAFLDGAGDRPFFLFAHYFDPHYEYRNHADWDWADGYRGWLRDQLDFENLLKNRHLLGPAELAFLTDLYDEEVAFTDLWIGRLLDGLAERGLAERTLVVVVSDHGEEFLERGSLGHTIGLHQEQVHVPLVVAFPPEAGAAAGEVRRGPVETRAVYGTVLAQLGIDFAPAAKERSLFAPRPAGASGTEALAFSTVWLQDAQPSWGKQFRLASVVAGPWKLILDLTRGRTFLYDLETDPAEERELSEEGLEPLEDLRRMLEAWIEVMQSRGADAPRGEIDPQMQERLKRLGYL